MLTPASNDSRPPPFEDLCPAVSDLIDAAVAAFDVDRDSSRRYLLRASWLLCGNRKLLAADKAAGRSSAHRGLLSWQLNRLVDYIESHLAEKLVASDLAAVIQLSDSRMFRLFRVSVGSTPFEYIAQRRIERVCHKLKTTDEPLAQIAIDCGLYDQAHLCRLFRRLMGATPIAWRRAAQLGVTIPLR